MRYLFTALTVLVCATHSAEVRAQPVGGDMAVSDARQSRPLSAAIEQVLRSPFHATDSRLVLPSRAPLGLGLPVFQEPRQNTGRPPQSAASDSTFSATRVFLLSWGAAALSDVAGFYFAICTEGGGGCVLEGGAGGLAMMTVPVLGTAAGARLGGARFGPALAGSAAGFGAVILQIAMGAIVDPDDSFVLFIAIPSVIQAGITTLVASRFR